MSHENLSELQAKYTQLQSQKARTQGLFDVLVPSAADLEQPKAYNDRIAELHPRGSAKLTIDRSSSTFIDNITRIGRLQTAIPQRILPAFDKNIDQVSQSIAEIEIRNQFIQQLEAIRTREQKALLDVAGLGQVTIDAVKDQFDKERAKLQPKTDIKTEQPAPKIIPVEKPETKQGETTKVLLPDGQELPFRGELLLKIAKQFIDAYNARELMDGSRGAPEIYGPESYDLDPKKTRKNYRAQVAHLREVLEPTGWRINQLLTDAEIGGQSLPALYILEKALRAETDLTKDSGVKVEDQEPEVTSKNLKQYSVTFPNGAVATVIGELASKMLGQIARALEEGTDITVDRLTHNIYGDSNLVNNNKISSNMRHIGKYLEQAGYQYLGVKKGVLKIAHAEKNPDGQEQAVKTEIETTNPALIDSVNNRISALNLSVSQFETLGRKDLLSLAKIEIDRMMQLLELLPKLPSFEEQATKLLQAILPNIEQKKLLEKIYAYDIKHGLLSQEQALDSMNEDIDRLNPQLEQSGIKIEQKLGPDHISTYFGISLLNSSPDK